MKNRIKCLFSSCQPHLGRVENLTWGESKTPGPFLLEGVLRHEVGPLQMV